MTKEERRKEIHTMFHYINRLSLQGEHWDEYDTLRELNKIDKWILAQSQPDWKKVIDIINLFQKGSAIPYSIIEILEREINIISDEEAGKTN